MRVGCQLLAGDEDEVRSAKCGMRSAECEGRSGECGVLPHFEEVGDWAGEAGQKVLPSQRRAGAKDAAVGGHMAHFYKLAVGMVDPGELSAAAEEVVQSPVELGVFPVSALTAPGFCPFKATRRDIVLRGCRTRRASDHGLLPGRPTCGRRDRDAASVIRSTAQRRLHLTPVAR